MKQTKLLFLLITALAFASCRPTAREQGWTLEQTLHAMLRAEYERRLAGRQRQRIKNAGFTQLKFLEQLDRDELPEGIRPILPRLETLDFIRQRRNIVLYGNPGTGKTHVATALAIKACMEGMHVLFTSVPHLITQGRGQVHHHHYQPRIRQMGRNHQGQSAGGGYGRQTHTQRTPHKHERTIIQTQGN